jgi:hypothetical protein
VRVKRRRRDERGRERKNEQNTTTYTLGSTGSVIGALEDSQELSKVLKGLENRVFCLFLLSANEHEWRDRTMRVAAAGSTSGRRSPWGETRAPGEEDKARKRKERRSWGEEEGFNK